MCLAHCFSFFTLSRCRAIALYVLSPLCSWCILFFATLLTAATFVSLIYSYSQFQQFPLFAFCLYRLPQVPSSQLGYFPDIIIVLLCHSCTLYLSHTSKSFQTPSAPALLDRDYCLYYGRRPLPDFTGCWRAQYWASRLYMPPSRCVPYPLRAPYF